MTSSGGGSPAFPQFEALIRADVVTRDELRRAAVYGIPDAYRPTFWKVRQGLLPLARPLRSGTPRSPTPAASLLL